MTNPEDVSYGHGSLRESVYKQRLEQPLSIVEGMADCSNPR